MLPRTGSLTLNLFGLIPRRLRRNFFCRVGRQGYRLPTRIETREQCERVTAQPLGTRQPPPCGDKSVPLPIPRPLGRGILLAQQWLADRASRGGYCMMYFA